LRPSSSRRFWGGCSRRCSPWVGGLSQGCYVGSPRKETELWQAVSQVWSWRLHGEGEAAASSFGTVPHDAEEGRVPGRIDAAGDSGGNGRIRIGEEGGIQRADPRARRKALFILLAVLLAALLTLAGVRMWTDSITTLAEKDPHEAAQRLSRWLWWLGPGLTSPVFAFSVWLWSFARRVRRSGRHPPPGVPVLRDVRIRTGHEAFRLARWISASSVLVAALAAACWLVLWRLASVFGRMHP